MDKIENEIRQRKSDTDRNSDKTKGKEMIDFNSEILGEL